MDGGANVSAVDQMGRTARDLAVADGRKYAIEALDGEELTGFRFFQGEFIER